MRPTARTVARSAGTGRPVAVAPARRCSVTLRPARGCLGVTRSRIALSRWKSPGGCSPTRTKCSSTLLKRPYVGVAAPAPGAISQCSVPPSDGKAARPSDSPAIRLLGLEHPLAGGQVERVELLERAGGLHGDIEPVVEDGGAGHLPGHRAGEPHDGLERSGAGDDRVRGEGQQVGAGLRPQAAVRAERQPHRLRDAGQPHGVAALQRLGSATPTAPTPQKFGSASSGS